MMVRIKLFHNRITNNRYKQLKNREMMLSNKGIKKMNKEIKKIKI